LRFCLGGQVHGRKQLHLLEQQCILLQEIVKLLAQLGGVQPRRCGHQLQQLAVS
jgi:hypothetical protein